MVTIKVFNSREEAEVVRGFLASKGILSFVSADDQGGLRPSLSFSNGVDLLVRSEDLETAKKALAEAET